MMTEGMKRIMMMAAVAAAMLTAASCGNGKTDKAVEMGPEQTLEAFCRAVASGEFDRATAFCDTTAMKEYIEAYAQAWVMQAKADSSATAIAGGVLSEAEITVEDVTREGEKRHILYIMDAGNGLMKEKKATVKKEEGVWKVERITDRT